jgi:hypothetical protein
MLLPCWSALCTLIFLPFDDGAPSLAMLENSKVLMAAIGLQYIHTQHWGRRLQQRMAMVLGAMFRHHRVHLQLWRRLHKEHCMRRLVF